jgi:hypothetical protein
LSLAIALSLIEALTEVPDTERLGTVASRLNYLVNASNLSASCGVSFSVGVLRIGRRMFHRATADRRLGTAFRRLRIFTRIDPDAGINHLISIRCPFNGCPSASEWTVAKDGKGSSARRCNYVPPDVVACPSLVTLTVYREHPPLSGPPLRSISARLRAIPCDRLASVVWPALCDCRCAFDPEKPGGGGPRVVLLQPDGKSPAWRTNERQRWSSEHRDLCKSAGRRRETREN